MCRKWMAAKAIGAMLALCIAVPALAAYQPEVVISDPYLDMHTGPGRGYPIFYVAGQGDRVRLLKRRTEWYKVRTPRGKEGWVHVSQLTSTLDLDGQPIDFHQLGVDDFRNRRWEFGFSGGDFDGAALLTVYSAYALTPNISAQISASQIMGDYSDGAIGAVNLLMQPFPEWRVSPFFTLGTGILRVEPQTTIVQSEDRTDEIVHVGLGTNLYLGRRFVFRVEYKHHTVLTSRDDNQEIDEWKAGFSVFL